MDTARLEANFGNENLFLIGIIIIVTLIILYFLLKTSKKDNKSTKKVVNATPENTSKLEEDIKQKTFTNRLQDEHGTNQSTTQKGRSGRKGYKEDEFLLYIQKYFKEKVYPLIN